MRGQATDVAIAFTAARHPSTTHVSFHRESRLKAEAQERLRTKFGSGGMGAGSGGSGPYQPRRRGGSGTDDFVAGFEETTQKAAVAASKAWGLLSSAVSVGVSRVAQSASQLAAEMERQQASHRQAHNHTPAPTQSPPAAATSGPPVSNAAGGKYGGVGNSMPRREAAQGGAPPPQAADSGAAALDKLAGSASQWFSSASAGLGSLWGELSAPAPAPATAPRRPAPSKYGSAGPSSTSQPPAARSHSSHAASTAPAPEDDDSWLAELVPGEDAAAPSATVPAPATENDDAWADEAGWDWQEDSAAPAPAPAPAAAAAQTAPAPAAASSADDDFFDDW